MKFRRSFDLLTFEVTGKCLESRSDSVWELSDCAFEHLFLNKKAGARIQGPEYMVTFKNNAHRERLRLVLYFKHKHHPTTYILSVWIAIHKSLIYMYLYIMIITHVFCVCIRLNVIAHTLETQRHWSEDHTQLLRPKQVATSLCLL